MSGQIDPHGEVKRHLGRRILRAFVGLLRWVVDSCVGAVTRAWTAIECWLLDSKKARYGIAITRIVIGLTGLGLLLANYSTRLYSFGPGSAWNGELAEPKSDFPKIWLFSAFHWLSGEAGAYTALYLVLMVLALLVVLGWRFKFVLPVYFVLWVSYIEANDMLGDQGDNMYRIVLILFFFADPAGRLSLDSRRRARAGELAGRGWLRRKWGGEPFVPREVSALFHNLALVCLAAQVSFVYVSGALYKAGGQPWAQGYAIYNPLATDRFGTWPELSEFFTTWAPLLALLTWSSVVLQLSFPFMLLSRPTRIIALFGIMSFHIGIAVLMGLPWFSLTMIAIDFIFVRDVTWAIVGARIRSAWRYIRGSEEAPHDAIGAGNVRVGA